MVYTETDSYRIVTGICGRRLLWRTTATWHQNTLVAKCIIPLLLFCRNLGKIGPVVQKKTQKKEIFCYVEREGIDYDCTYSKMAVGHC